MKYLYILEDKTLTAWFIAPIEGGVTENIFDVLKDGFAPYVSEKLHQHGDKIKVIIRGAVYTAHY